MPQVVQEQPKDQRNPLTVIFVLVAVVAILIASFDLVKPAPASAAGQTLPNPAQTQDPDNTSLAFVLAESRTTDVINAPTSWVKFYFAPTDATGAVRIFNAPFDCGSIDDHVNPQTACTTGNRIITNNPSQKVVYDFFAMNTTNEAFNPTNPGNGELSYLFSLDGQTGRQYNTTTGADGVALTTAPAANWTGNINVPLTVGGVPIPVSTVTGFRVVVMRARYATCAFNVDDNCETHVPQVGTDNQLHAFQVQTTTNTDQVGYWSQAGPGSTFNPGSAPPVGQYNLTALGYKFVDYESTSEFDFAPPCGFTGSQTSYIRWFDADNSDEGGGDGDNPRIPNDHPVFFTFTITNAANPQFDETATVTGTGTTIVTPAGTTHTGLIVGGNNQYEDFAFTAHPGDKYEWKWIDLNGPTKSPVDGSLSVPNNMQFWLPYDSINATLSCFDYNTNVAPADGKALGGQNLNLATAADQHVEMFINAQNNGGDTGPVATTAPTVCQWVSATSCINTTFATLDPAPNPPPAIPPWDLNRVIVGGATLLGANTGVKYGYAISPTTPNGTVLCFGSTILPHTSLGDIVPFASTNQVCDTVLNARRYPAVVGSNSDVQAGGGLCDMPLSTAPGSFTGNPLSNSGDQYVVAATGGINSFASNNGKAGVNPGTDSLKLGTTGGYAQVCREDLLAAANAGLGGPDQGTIGGVGTVNVDLGCLTTPAANCGSATGGASVYYFNGSVLQLSGVIKSKITIVATNGSVEITGPITITGGTFAPTNAPSLGVIAKQTIAVDAGVTRVDAYLFADGMVNTCSPNNNPATLMTACGVPTPKLLVNGFLMGNNIEFSRLGPSGSIGAVVAEDVELNPQIYLNPPKFFDNSVDQATLEGEGERPPLF